VKAVRVELVRMMAPQIAHRFTHPPQGIRRVVGQRPAMQQIRERRHVARLAPGVEQLQTERIDALDNVLPLGQTGTMARRFDIVFRKLIIFEKTLPRSRYTLKDGRVTS
jgi:hypothetical protein